MWYVKCRLNRCMTSQIAVNIPTSAFQGYQPWLFQHGFIIGGYSKYLHLLWINDAWSPVKLWQLQITNIYFHHTAVSSMCFHIHGASSFNGVTISSNNSSNAVRGIKLFSQTREWTRLLDTQMLLTAVSHAAGVWCGCWGWGTGTEQTGGRQGGWGEDTWVTQSENRGAMKCVCCFSITHEGRCWMQAEYWHKEHV